MTFNAEDPTASFGLIADRRFASEASVAGIGQTSIFEFETHFLVLRGLILVDFFVESKDLFFGTYTLVDSRSERPFL